MKSEKETTEKVTKKSSRSTKKSAVKKTEIDWEKVTVNGGELSEWLAFQASNLPNLRTAGIIKRNSDNSYNLKESVISYIRELRNRKKSEANSKVELDAELQFWRLQNLKVKNQDWRIQFGKDLVAELIRCLQSTMTKIKEQSALNPALCGILEQAITDIGSVNVDRVVLAVDGSEDITAGEENELQD